MLLLILFPHLIIKHVRFFLIVVPHIDRTVGLIDRIDVLGTAAILLAATPTTAPTVLLTDRER